MLRLRPFPRKGRPRRPCDGEHPVFRGGVRPELEEPAREVVQPLLDSHVMHRAKLALDSDQHPTTVGPAGGREGEKRVRERVHHGCELGYPNKPHRIGWLCRLVWRDADANSAADGQRMVAQALLGLHTVKPSGVPDRRTRPSLRFRRPRRAGPTTATTLRPTRSSRRAAAAAPGAAALCAGPCANLGKFDGTSHTRSGSTAPTSREMTRS